MPKSISCQLGICDTAAAGQMPPYLGWSSHTGTAHGEPTTHTPTLLVAKAMHMRRLRTRLYTTVGEIVAFNHGNSLVALSWCAT
jgi:hypothetical protein